ncbi:MAG TPA: DUF349 domain-containing protein [Paludibacteraceae bacterium]|jgi:hypothetical protein|nr:DUF349 domain-containing protein [Paludibacteraceae bacterium]HQB69082.1 DUF349 domain-containing protein [Paludibacteraceae bacterium]HRS68271.1 DUF349 domain-containing protein [Paludibacteraceae bacterium]
MEKPENMENKVDKLIEVVEAVAVHNNEFYALTRQEMIDKMRELLKVKPIADAKESIDNLKQAFYKNLKSELEDSSSTVETDKVKDDLEIIFKELLAEYKTLKAQENALLDAEKETNLQEKKRILAELEILIASSDDLSATIPAFRKLQQTWKSIGQVPANAVNSIWKTYNQYQEKFYDLIKLNNELREYDFKKNLELKTALCETAERLSTEPDPVEAFKLLQKLHDEWREIGPVARELREDIWNRFKTASTVINKQHQTYFESIKEAEEKFIAEKNAICEQVEAIDYATLKTHKQWEKKTQEILNLQEKWKTIGGVPSTKKGQKAFKRFRLACDKFFNEKKEFFKRIKGEIAQNLEAKKALCAQAEALKDSTEWQETAEKLIQLQKEWKTIGPTAKKQSDAVWQRFVTACDYFFEQKNLNFTDKNSEELTNLKAKKAIIEQVNEFKSTGNTAEDIAALKALVEAYNKIGFVPFRDKDKIYKAFKTATDKQFKALRGVPTHKTSSERNKLLKEYDKLKAEIATYENNIGFFTASSKKANSLVAEMNKKIDSLKSKLADIVAKIDEIDQQ